MNAFKKFAVVMAVFCWISAFTVSAETLVVTTTQPTKSPAQPEDSVRMITLSEVDGEGILTESPSTYVFWEYPQLQAGQTRTGTLRFVNAGSFNASLSLSLVGFPVDDALATAYFDALQMTITAADGSTVYKGAYSKLANEKIFQDMDLELGKAIEYGITLRCPFEFTGETADASTRITWIYKASSQIPAEPQFNPALVPVLWGTGILLALLLTVFVFLSVKKKRNRKPPVR